MCGKTPATWPENDPGRKGLLTRLTDCLMYSYMNPILQKGSRLHQQRQGPDKSSNDEITQDDLFEAPETMKSQCLNDKFQSIYSNKRFRLKERQKKMEKKTKGIVLSGSKSNHQSWMFMRVLLELSLSTYVPAGLYQLITVIVQSLCPIVLQNLLNLFEENPDSSILTLSGLSLAVSLFLISIIDGIAQERHRFLAFQSGITIRAATINAIYNQMLQLSSKGKESLMTGEITNLVAVDCQKLFEVFQEGHLLWSCPLSMIIVTVLLLFTLGKSTLVGVSCMIINVPIVKMIVSKMIRIRMNRFIHTDKRVQITSSMLNAIRFCKLNNYEEKFLERLYEARAHESSWIRKELSMIGWTLTFTVLSPVIASALTFITYALIDGGNVLTSSETFTTVLLFSLLRLPINYVGKLMGKLAQSIEACNRIALFLERDVAKSICDSRGQHSMEESLLRIKNVDFTVDKAEDAENNLDDADTESSMIKAAFSLSNINLSLRKSEVHCVVGQVGSGKSSLLNGIIGELASNPSSDEEAMQLIMNGTVVLASQSPFILNATIRDNILFGADYNEDLYDRVLNACNLKPDLKQLGSSGDLTEIGERGVTLSGGQKARISIARCVYAQPAIALFDDVLSALDASTGKMIFDNLFDTKNKQRLLSNSAVLLVTHATHFLSRVDNIMVLVDGKSVFSGHWEEMKSAVEDVNTHKRDVLKNLCSSVQEGHECVACESSEENKVNIHAAEGTKIDLDNTTEKEEEKGGLMSVEEREFGLCGFQTWFTWFRYAGGFFFTSTTLLLLTFDRCFYVLNELWLANWTSAENEQLELFAMTFPSQSIDLPRSQYGYIKVYASILALSCFATAIRSQLIIQGGATCSEKLFKEVAKRVIHAPMSYFETTPSGRILNRLTFDVEILDISLSCSMSMLMTTFGWIITGLSLLISILPHSSLVLIPVTALYWLLLMYYRKSAVDLQRLDAVSRSPVQAKVNEGFEGSTTIRVFDKFNHFQHLLQIAVDQNTSAMMNFMASQRWLGVRFLILGSIVTLFVTMTTVSFNHKLGLEAGFIGVLISWAQGFSGILSFFSQAVSESEAYMTSLERLQSMTQLPQERNILSTITDKNWPKDGSVSFQNVSLRYRSGLPLALNGLSFSASSGQRVGICGRTGAGKSTVAGPALFQLCELESGQIILDGEDLSKLRLADVRGRRNGMCIISQEPVLFSGSLRECLDPWGYSTDEEILEALQTVQVGDTKRRGVKALEDFVEEGGRNYSVGERQLLCLVRAVLAKPKLLVLDEATASVDAETDASIQKMIRERFEGTTLLTIAHRLHTIVDYDVVLVMDKGRVAEFGAPVELLGKNNGMFSKLVDSTGKESSLMLRQLAEKAANEKI